MRAVGYQDSLPIEAANALVDIKRPKPVACGRDLLVQVQAVSVNPVDTKVRRRAKPEPGDWTILGYDAAGTVVATGPDATLFQPGDTVFYAGDMTRPGTNAELHLVDERIVGRKPKSLDWAQAAALPLTAITAWEALFDRLNVLQAGARRGGGDPDHRRRRRRGLDRDPVAAAARRPDRDRDGVAAGDPGVGASGSARTMSSTMPAVGGAGRGARHRRAGVCVFHHQHRPAPGGDRRTDRAAGPVRADRRSGFARYHCRSSARAFRCIGSSCSPGSMFHTADMDAQGALLNEVARLVDEGTLRTTIGENFGPISAANLKRAHALIESGRARGKIVLEGFAA